MKGDCRGTRSLCVDQGKLVHTKKNPLFKRLKENWQSINKTNFQIKRWLFLLYVEVN
uniref:Uncharacterized protein n=1 Tax=Lepeophtheirus salmonis TaxID=72036 RepID=A0A0K2U2N1_LEPSM